MYKITVLQPVRYWKVILLYLKVNCDACMHACNFLDFDISSNNNNWAHDRKYILYSLVILYEKYNSEKFFDSKFQHFIL